ncbi:hypothetical protein [Terrisporobacter hibernicus]|uniref:Uncharacterized protein n=1 Tax=Terrisporobacter hibernicus TaxID=2813371 RepID=A0AAX2ZD47_9FIRM|nr:hypothetical protein [Terrisporobacter hibernicus]UEL47214.1 hypothetical protein JW646_16510 [Terrisporobacter hibernicus]
MYTRKNDVIVTIISQDGIQEEKNVNTLLKEVKLIDILGEDVVFTFNIKTWYEFKK